MGNNSKLIFAVVTALVIVGAALAVRNLTAPADDSESSEIRRSKENSEGTEISSTGSGRSGNTRISGIDDKDSNAERRGTDGKTITRGKSAASIDVTPATTTSAQLANAAAMEEMDDDTSDTEENSREIADLVSRFLNETDPEARVDIADELGLIDDPAAIRKILELLANETDVDVQIALLEAMQALDALEMTSAEVLKGVQDILARSTDPDVRVAAQDLLGDLATPEAINLLRSMQANANADPADRLNAAENLMRIHAINPELISAQEAAALTEQLKLDYQAGTDSAFRAQAIMALAINGRENLPFFQESLQSEQDPQLRNLLERLVRMYTAQQPAAPPAGTVVTPAPTP